jgi:ABC-type nickel/cobalt efflux system permease component RcnA
MSWLVEWQTIVHRVLVGDLTRFAADRDWLALATVLPAGILFGAIHALTPGHGKSLLASYVLGSRLASLKAAAVAAVLSLTHVGMAVVLALLAAPLVTRTIGGVGRAPVLEAASGVLLVAIGIWMVARGWRVTRPHQHEGMAMGVFAGLVPCPLTLFVMMYALARHVPEAGVTFAIAMMLGVTVTLASVAILAVLARERLSRVLAATGGSVARISRALDLISGGLVMLLGLGQIFR